MLVNSGKNPPIILILGGVNYWNAGDLGSFDSMVNRITTVLPTFKIVSLTIFSAKDKPRDLPARNKVKEIEYFVTLPSSRILSLSIIFIVVIKFVRSMVLGFLINSAGLRVPSNLGRLSQTLHIMKEASVITSKGGNFLLDLREKLSYSWLLPLHQILLSTIMNRNVVLYSQSIGPFKRKFSSIMVNMVLSRAKCILLRERKSLEFLRLLRRTKIFITADEAFCMEEATSSEVNKVIKELGLDVNGRIVAFSPIKWSYPGAKQKRELYEKYVKALARTINYVVQRYDAKILILPHVTSFFGYDDLLAVNDILHHVDQPKNIVVAPSDLSPRVEKGLLHKVDALVGTRMHSNIFALSVGTPVVAVSYLPKTDGIMEMMGLLDFVIPIDELTFERLQQKVDSVFEEHEELSEMIKKMSQAMRWKAEKNMFYIKSLLEGRLQ